MEFNQQTCKTFFVFLLLKLTEIVGFVFFTYGVYCLGRIFYWLMGWLEPNWFMLWLVGLAFFSIILAMACVVAGVIAVWLKFNWAWAKAIVTKEVSNRFGSAQKKRGKK